MVSTREQARCRDGACLPAVTSWDAMPSSTRWASEVVVLSALLKDAGHHTKVLISAPFQEKCVVET